MSPEVSASISEVLVASTSTAPEASRSELITRAVAETGSSPAKLSVNSASETSGEPISASSTSR